MDAGLATARQARAQHRHELRTLTYVTLDQANGGIVRNLTHHGIGVQAVAAVRPRQQLRVRFELRYPRLRVETRGEVMWSTFSGQCGIRFLDLPPRMVRQIDEWIFGSLLEGMSLHTDRTDSIFGDSRIAGLSLRAVKSVPPNALSPAEQADGLMISPAALKVIDLPARPEPSEPNAQADDSVPEAAPYPMVELDWLSQPLSGRSLAWTVDALVVTAALLMFALVFLSVTRELPKWPIAMTSGAVVLVTAMYWAFFKLFGGASLGSRLARLAGSDFEEEDAANRFR